VSQKSSTFPKETLYQELSPAWWYPSVGSYMRAFMGLHKDRNGTYYARVKVPTRLQEPVAHVLGNGKHKQVFLKRSLRTKDLRVANVRVKPVLVGFDGIFAQAKARLKAQPVRTTLSDAEIKRMSDYVYYKALATDDAFVGAAPEEEALTRKLVEEEHGPQEWVERRSVCMSAKIKTSVQPGASLFGPSCSTTRNLPTVNSSTSSAPKRAFFITERPTTRLPIASAPMATAPTPRRPAQAPRG
jgi:uncharacterized protein DUF6538